MVEGETIKVGWIGTGVMGMPMCKHIMTKKGYPMSVFNRTACKADPLVEAGASYKDPIEIAKEVDILIIMLGYPIDVEVMCLDHEKGILKHMKEGSYLIDHTSSSPGLAMKVAEEGKKYGVGCLDAPVSGGDIGAQNGALVTMVGGEEAAVARDLSMDTKLVSNLTTSSSYSMEVPLVASPW